jgi:hypothetical protein
MMWFSAALTLAGLALAFGAVAFVGALALMADATYEIERDW